MENIDELKLLDIIREKLKSTNYIRDYKQTLPNDLNISPSKLESLLITLESDGHMKRSENNPNIISFVFKDFDGYLNTSLNNIDRNTISAEILRLTIENLKLQNKQLKFNIFWAISMSLLGGLFTLLGVVLGK